MKTLVYEIGLNYDEYKFLKLIRTTDSKIIAKKDNPTTFTSNGSTTYTLLVKDKDISKFTKYILSQEEWS